MASKKRGQHKVQKKLKAGQPHNIKWSDVNNYQEDNIISKYEKMHTANEGDKAYEQALIAGYGYGTTWKASYWDCHKGNTKLLSSGRGTGGSLYIGGWSRGAHHSEDMTVFDLTGGSTPKGHRGTWYPIHMEDYGVPQWSLFFWESLAMTIYHELSSGDVLITCQGGHGRSGMFAAIIAYMLRDKRYIRILETDKLMTDPIWWIREVYCQEAVETVAQELCVYETCLEFKPNLRLQEALEETRKRPRYVYKPASYTKLGDDWLDEEKKEEEWICPLCTLEHDTMIEALMCCSTIDSLRYCPVCLTKHSLPIDAYNCCKIES